MITNSFNTADNKYSIQSHGNGWAYEVTCLNSGDTLWFQDHDADQLQADTNDFTDTCVIDQHFECNFN